MLIFVPSDIVIDQKKETLVEESRLGIINSFDALTLSLVMENIEL